MTPLVERNSKTILGVKRKRKAPKIVDRSSLTMRNLARHAMPPPTVKHIDRKKKRNKRQCRDDSEL